MGVRKLEFDSRQDWLKKRKTFLGGSEITAILGIDDYRTPMDVWEIKTGRRMPDADNKHTLAGRFLEDGIARYWEHETGNRIIKASGVEHTYIHPEHTFLGGSPDRRYFVGGSKDLSDRRVWEGKTTMKKIDHDDIPLSWWFQPNYYCGLLGYKKFTIAWFEFFTKELKWVEFDFNQEIYDDSITAMVDFWNDHIIEDNQPDPINTNDYKKLYPESQEGKLIVATDEVMDTYSEHITLRRQIKEIQKLESGYKDNIKMLMKDAEKMVSPEMSTLYSYKTDKRGYRKLMIKEI